MNRYQRIIVISVIISVLSSVNFFAYANNQEVLSCEKLSQITMLFEQGKAEQDAGHDEQAILLFDAGIKQIGDDYLSEDVEDDTSTKLSLAQFEQQAGNRQQAAVLTHNVFSSRLALLKNRYPHCHELM